MALALSAPVFAILRELIEQRTGLHYELGDRELLGDRLSTRAQALGFDSLLDYYYFLRYDPDSETELRRLVDELVIGETYFFRELDQLTVLVDRFLAPWVRQGRRPRVWSAACATGEEPVTLAMLLDERGLLDAVELVATDISERALSRARAGVYGRRAVRGGAPPALVSRWLEPGDGGPRVRGDLLTRIQWDRVNLIERAEVERVGVFDVILCRNVLIYFADATVTRVLDHLGGALRPDGVLAVGISESLMRYGTGWRCEEHQGVFFYRRTA